MFRPAGAKVMFSSPNGFMMFGQFDSIGDRVDRAPDGTDRAEIHRLPVAHSCMSCHTAGPIAVRDEVRSLAFKDTTQKPVRDAILALHPEQSSIDGLMTEDRQQLQRSLAAAGVDVKRTVRGRDPLAALIARYEQAGDIDAIAIEAGRTREDIQRLTLTKPDDIR